MAETSGRKSPPRVVFARDTCAVRMPQGGVARLEQDQPWRADDEFVRARPDLFSDTPAKLNGTAPEDGEQTDSRRRSVRRDHQVERATRRPGEKRS